MVILIPDKILLNINTLMSLIHAGFTWWSKGRRWGSGSAAKHKLFLQRAVGCGTDLWLRFNLKDQLCLWTALIPQPDTSQSAQTCPTPTKQLGRANWLFWEFSKVVQWTSSNQQTSMSVSSIGLSGCGGQAVLKACTLSSGVTHPLA